MDLSTSTSSESGLGPFRRLRRLAGILAAGVLVIAPFGTGPVRAQDWQSRLRSFDLYRTSELDIEEFKRLNRPAVLEIVEAFAAGDFDSVERVGAGVRAAIEAGGDFAYIEISLTTSFDGDTNDIDVTIELVDTADAESRLSFAAAPTGSVEDPDGVLAAWAEYQSTALDLVNARQMSPEILLADCPALHCVFGFDHDKLGPFLARFDRAARENRATLLRVLRENSDAEERAAAVFVLAHGKDADWLVEALHPSLDDPAAEVRNNVLRVMSMIAQTDDRIEIPFAPLARRIDDPSGGVRNKTSLLIAAIAHRPEYRDDILAILPSVMRLLRMAKPNNHDPAYEILKTISGRNYGDRDYARWEAWVAAKAVVPAGARE